MKWYWKFILTVVFVFLSCAGVLYLMLPETQDGVYKEAVSEEGHQMKHTMKMLMMMSTKRKTT